MERPQTKSGGTSVGRRACGHIFNKTRAFFSRAPTQKFSSAARRPARRRRRKFSGTSPTCRFHEEIGPSRAPVCSPCGPAPAADERCSCSSLPLGLLGATGTTTMEDGTFNLRRSNAPSGQCCGALRARRGAQKVTAQRVLGGARKALLEDRGNESKRLRHNKIRHSRAGHIHVCFDSKIRRPYADVRPCMVVYSG